MSVALPQEAIERRKTRAAQTQVRIALAMVVLPLVGFAAAIALAWGWGVSAAELVLLGVMYVLGIIGVEIGLHRYFSHRAFRAVPAVTALLAILGSMAGQGPVLFWVATHRKHHAHSDHDGDPHSPYTVDGGPWCSLRGWWHAHVGWLFLGDPPDLGAYAPDLLRDRYVFRLNQLYPLWFLLGLAVPAGVGWLIHRTAYGAFLGFLWGGLARLFLVHHATWSVNSLCHLLGQRPNATRDRSTNNVWLALPSLGGSWHNNHHAFPRAASTSLAWWQADPCGWLIQCGQWCGLIWDVQRAKAEGLASVNTSSSAPPALVLTGDPHE